MNCECIDKIEQKLVGREFGDRKKKVLKVKFLSAGLIFGENKLTKITNSELELEVEGYKKPQKQSMVHSFCPFCGTKIEKN